MRLFQQKASFANKAAAVLGATCHKAHPTRRELQGHQPPVRGSSLKLTLQVAAVDMGYTAQDVEDIAAELLGDHPQALMVGPVALDDDRRARGDCQAARRAGRVPRGTGGAQAGARAAGGAQARRQGDLHRRTRQRPPLQGGCSLYIGVTASQALGQASAAALPPRAMLAA